MAETKPYLSVALPCVTMASRPTRSVKRRPRSRRDARSTILSCFEQPVVEDGATGLLPDINNSRHPNIPSSTAFTDSAGPQSLNSTTTTTSNSSNNNYLEFLLQSDGSLLQNVQIFSPEFSDDPAGLYASKDSDSCSPDSVITNFTADVFDSLEPLSSTPSEWWAAQ
jgi:hypothetical protein